MRWNSGDWKTTYYLGIRRCSLLVFGRPAAVMYTETDGRQQVLSRRNAVSTHRV